MKKTLAALSLAAGFLIVGASPAIATETVPPVQPGTQPVTSPTPVPPGTGPAPSWETCPNLKAWYANEDEQNRLPSVREGGLEFVGNDLIHHAASLKLQDLQAGSYSASPAPGQNSFFSVEIRDENGAYGTLRWNTSTSMWDLIAKGNLVSKANPADFVGVETKWGTITTATKVISFGVGYTNSPSSDVKTLVKSVTWAGQTWKLDCVRTPTNPPTTTKPPVTQPPTEPTTESPSPDETPVGPGGDDGGAGAASLPVTGAPVGLIAGGGISILLLGAGVVLATRKRKTRYTA